MVTPAERATRSQIALYGCGCPTGAQISLTWPDLIFRIESGASLNINPCFQCFDLRGQRM